MTERAQTLSMPRRDCNDVTDLWRAGEDLAAWVAGQVGPEDAGQYLQWAQHYMDAVDDEVFAAGPDKASPAARVWHALLERHDRILQELGALEHGGELSGNHPHATCLQAGDLVQRCHKDGTAFGPECRVAAVCAKQGYIRVLDNGRESVWPLAAGYKVIF